VLVDLARALEVSLDYLVYGRDSSEGAEYAVWAQHLDDTVRRLSSEAASLRQLVDRMGITISDRIHKVATEVVKQAGARGGALTTTEVMQVERYSSCTKIARVDLDADVRLPKETSPDSFAAPGPFAGVLVANISEGKDYVFVIPDGGRAIREARLMAQEAKKAVEAHEESGTSRVAVADHLQFYAAADGLVPGFAIYNLDCSRMAKERPFLYDLVEGFLGVETQIDDANQNSSDILAVIQPPNPGFDVYPLISREHIPTLTKGFENLRRQSDRLSFVDYPNPAEG
jgi:hypothetical protein